MSVLYFWAQDYFLRDCHFSGVVKVSFDPTRLMQLARVARADGRLQVCFPVKAMGEVLHVFQTRFNLHLELYSHRAGAAVGLMLRDALLAADDTVTVRGAAGRPLGLSDCGSAMDEGLEGYLQLTDGSVMAMIAAAAQRQEAEQAMRKGNQDEGVVGGAQCAAALIRRIDCRELYQFVGSVDLPPEHAHLATDMKAVARRVAVHAFSPAGDALSEGVVGDSAELLRAVVRRVSYGNKDQNPLTRVRFFDSKQAVQSGALREEERGSGFSEVANGQGARDSDGSGGVEEAHLHPLASRHAALPVRFEYCSVRVYLTTPKTHASAADELSAAKRGLARWCTEMGLPSDACYSQ